MRNIRKTIKVANYKVKVYNTVEKKEQELDLTITEVEKEIVLPENCIEIERDLISEKEVVFKMTPQEFVLYATEEK